MATKKLYKRQRQQDKMTENSYEAECAGYYARMRDHRIRTTMVRDAAKLPSNAYIDPSIKEDVEKLRAEMACERNVAIKRAKRDAASRRRTNLESVKFPGLVCGTMDSLVQAEECFEQAIEGKWTYIAMQGDIVGLPANLCTIIPSVSGMYCISDNLLGFPEGLSIADCPQFPEYGAAIKADIEMRASPIYRWVEGQLFWIKKQMLDVKGQMIGITGQAVKSEEQNLAIDRGTQEQIRLLKEQNKYLLGAVQRLEARLAAVELVRSTPQGETSRCETPQGEQVSDTN